MDTLRSELTRHPDIMIFDELETDDYIFCKPTTPEAVEYLISDKVCGFDKIDAGMNKDFWNEGNGTSDTVASWGRTLELDLVNDNRRMSTTLYGINKDYENCDPDKMFLQINYVKFPVGEAGSEVGMTCEYGFENHFFTPLTERCWSIPDAQFKRDKEVMDACRNFKGRTANNICKRIRNAIQDRAEEIYDYLTSHSSGESSWIKRIEKALNHSDEEYDE